MGTPVLWEYAYKGRQQKSPVSNACQNHPERQIWNPKAYNLSP